MTKPNEDDVISHIDKEQPNVVLFHDSLCKKINPTILSKEKVTTKKIWAPTLADIQKEITQTSKCDAVVIQSITRTLSNTSVEDIINQTTDTVEMCLLKADKVVISSIISRDDDPIVSAKAELVNAILKFKFLNNPKVLICNNDNLRDRKFRRGDGIHLTDHGISVFANNLKYKIAEALDIAVVKKIRNKSGYSRYTGYQRDQRDDRSNFYDEYD